MEANMNVVVEGINGSGKSTAMDRVVEQLKADGRSIRAFDPASATPWGMSLRNSLVATSWTENLSPTAAAFAFAACRVNGLRAFEKPTTQEIILLERWSGAVISYGDGTGADSGALGHVAAAMNSLFTADLEILIDLPVEVAADRLKRKGSNNWYELDGRAVLSRVRESYRRWAERCGAYVIDGNQAVELIVDDILAQINTVP
jgi:dTMP kinase